MHPLRSSCLVVVPSQSDDGLEGDPHSCVIHKLAWCLSKKQLFWQRLEAAHRRYDGVLTQRTALKIHQ